ncbi:Uncharacterised protein [Vibrio cholerae]|nr:Uncharacterised protein [Vibrio cholerae]
MPVRCIKIASFALLWLSLSSASASSRWQSVACMTIRTARAISLRLVARTSTIRF